MTHKSIFAALILAGMSFITGCQIIDPNTSGGSDVVYIWTAAYTDTYVSSDQPDMNFSANGDLIMGPNMVGSKGTGQVARSYVKFLVPRLPIGTKINEAYLETYHGGKNEDGTTDEITYDVYEVDPSFNAKTLTWNDVEQRSQAGAITPIMPTRFRSQDWCNTGDFAALMQQYVDGAQATIGFRTRITDIRTYYKSFYSNNSFGRSDSTLGKAPRLLLKITMPAGMGSRNNIVWPNLPADHDMRLGKYFRDNGGIYIASYQFGGDDFPASWGVKKNMN